MTGWTAKTAMTHLTTTDWKLTTLKNSKLMTTTTMTMTKRTTGLSLKATILKMMKHLTATTPTMKTGC